MEDILIQEKKVIKKQEMRVAEIDWDDLVATSDYLALLEIQKAFNNGRYKEVKKGFANLIDFFRRSEKVEVQELLEKLIKEIMMSKNNPELLEDGEWAVRVENLREDIAYAKKIYYFDISDDFLKSDWCWTPAINWATKKIKTEFGKKAKIILPTWEELFEIDYLDKIKIEA